MQADDFIISFMRAVLSTNIGCFIKMYNRPMELPSGGDDNRYQEHLPAALRGSYKEVAITGKIKDWSIGLNKFFETNAQPDAPEISVTLSQDQFLALPDEAQELVHDLALTPESHPRISISRPYEDKGFALSIDPQDYVQDGNAGITVSVGFPGETRLGRGIRYKNHTGRVIETSSLGFSSVHDFGTGIVEKYFNSPPTGEQGNYGLATSNLIFLHNKKISLLNAMIPWVEEQYLRRHDITLDPDVLRDRADDLTIDGALEQVQQIINPKPSLPPEEDEKIVDAAQKLLADHYRKIKPSTPRIIREAQDIANRKPLSPDQLSE